MVMQWLKNVLETVISRKPPVVRGGHLSVTGVLHRADGVPNQDSAFKLMRPSLNAHRNPENSPEQVRTYGIFVVGVFDGHGPQGDFVSALAAERMSFAIDRMLVDDDKADLEKVVRQAFKEVATALNSAPCGIGSGTTGSVALIKDGDLVIANVGDSKVLLLSDNGLGRVCTRYASPLHRPTDEKEAARVTEAGGQVIEGYVVDEGAKNGIAVSRTLGDRDMHQYGCISEPTVQYIRLCQEDSAIVLASDGLWDHEGMTEPDVWQAAAKRPGKTRTAKTVCQTLLEVAGRYGEPSDDCTVACLTLK